MGAQHELGSVDSNLKQSYTQSTGAYSSGSTSQLRVGGAGHLMNVFKKLQENSLYWRYRFVTRRYLAVKRWWRELRQPRGRSRMVRVVPRGMAANSPYSRGNVGVNATRGITFVVLLAAAWTALLESPLGQSGFPVGLLQIAALVLLVYLFVRFW
ncbi:MAG: hypothetical protein JWO42_1818 [Chloroflexi bacterium]|jgi:hypothetical protein|nr:hypothetical protein [Chloroflexota bacterium]